MKLSVISSSSKGNCYILENENEALLIEVGVPFKEIKKALNFNLRKVVGAVLTHEHKDHSKSLVDVLRAGIKVVASQGTVKTLNVKSTNNIIIKAGEITKLGSFDILAFDTIHDCSEPLGFLINHKDCGTVLFLTDTIYSAYTFKGLNNIIVESNYCEGILDLKYKAGETNEYLKNRVLNSHMSIKTCKKLLMANDLRNVHNIVLIHLSDSHSNSERFKKEVIGITGKKVTVARPGLQIDFNKQPF